MLTVNIKGELHRYIEVAQEPQLLAIYTLLEEKIKASHEHLSLQQYNEEIDASEKEYENYDAVLTHSAFKEEIKKW